MSWPRSNIDPDGDFLDTKYKKLFKSTSYLPIVEAKFFTPF